MTKLLNKKTLVILILIIVIVFVLFNIIKIQDVIQKIIYPRKYEAEVTKYSEEYGVDENLVFAIIKAESNFDENANSRKGAKGLMQIMYNTASDIAKTLNMEITEDQLMNTDTNINLGTKYISILIEKYQNIEVALAAYNAGSGNVDSWIEQGKIRADGSDIEKIPYKETNNYVRKILRDYKIYQNL